MKRVVMIQGVFALSQTVFGRQTIIHESRLMRTARDWSSPMALGRALLPEEGVFTVETLFNSSLQRRC
jgi:hypothetical protein